MPSEVAGHVSHSSRGRRFYVRPFIRNGPEHTAKWRRLVADLRREGEVRNPEAVATATLGEASFTKRKRGRKR